MTFSFISFDLRINSCKDIEVSRTIYKNEQLAVPRTVIYEEDIVIPRKAACEEHSVVKPESAVFNYGRGCVIRYIRWMDDSKSSGVLTSILINFILIFKVYLNYFIYSIIYSLLGIYLSSRKSF